MLDPHHPDVVLQTGDATEPDGSTVRFMRIRGTRVKTLETIGGDQGAPLVSAAGTSLRRDHATAAGETLAPFV
jgi:hypothetical protein